MQRLEFWKTAIRIIQQNILFGVGTGDVQHAFDDQYKKDNSKLQMENRLRAHNSFLTAWVTHGILGLLLFCTLIWVYFYTNMKQQRFLAVAFIFVATLTFLLEDTLETQMGVSFFAFFSFSYHKPINPKPYNKDRG